MPVMRRRRFPRRRWLLVLIGLTYASVAIGLLLGYDSRGLIDGFRGSIPRPAPRAGGPSADAFWADQGQPGR